MLDRDRAHDRRAARGKGWTVYARPARRARSEDLKPRAAKTLALDVTDEKSMERAVKQVTDEEERVGALVNNAGYSQSGALERCRWRVSAASSRPTSSAAEDVPAGAARNARPGLGPNRQPELDRRQGRLPRRRRLPRHQARGRALSDALRFEVADFGVKVVIIEPGLIKTEFGNTAAGSLADAGGDGLRKFNHVVGSATQGAYEGGMAKLGGGPRQSPRRSRRLSSRRPKTRYRVTPSAHMVLNTGRC